MARCIYCYNILTAKDDYCYHCGDRVPKFANVKTRRVSIWTNLAFVGALAFIACGFYAEKLTLPMTIGVASTLVLLRVFAEFLVNRDSN